MHEINGDGGIDSVKEKVVAGHKAEFYDVSI